MILAKINDAGVHKIRTHKDVQNKIEYIKKCFWCVQNWAHTETGEVLKRVTLVPLRRHSSASVCGSLTSTTLLRTVLFMQPSNKVFQNNKSGLMTK